MLCGCRRWGQSCHKYQAEAMGSDVFVNTGPTQLCNWGESGAASRICVEMTVAGAFHTLISPLSFCFPSPSSCSARLAVASRVPNHTMIYFTSQRRNLQTYTRVGVLSQHQSLLKFCRKKIIIKFKLLQHWCLCQIKVAQAQLPPPETNEDYVVIKYSLWKWTVAMIGALFMSA